jgi:tRNA 5-methylaminomethyl-2-thiouridine biosynthesis bifunctional protein
MADSAIASPSSLLELSQAWAGLPTWRALDSRFGHGAHFFSAWQAWRADPQAPRLLHYVALTAAPPTFEQLQDYGLQHPEFQNLVADLKAQWFGLTPGFHRLVLNDGQLLLTLCIGELTHLLREQQFEADSVFLDLGASALELAGVWDKWSVKALARCCRRGTLIGLAPCAAPLMAELEKGGFQFKEASLWGVFNPRWTLKRSRGAFKLQAEKVGTCAVIGAGLAGASVAAALAKRGWQVRVLDTAAAPASGASGLPVGLVVPHVSKDDCAQSRLSRSGVRLMLQQARQLLIDGQDWANTGVLEKQLDDTQAPSHGPPPGPIFHAQAAWLKPAQLVRAWLAQEGVSFRGQACVASLKKLGAQWQLLDTAGQELFCADRVVFANAGGALPLLETLQATQPPDEPRLALKRLPSVQGMRGLISWGLHGSATASASPNFPIMPVNGSGSMIPWVPVNTAPAHLEGETLPAWFVGSSYQSERDTERPDADNHSANLARLTQLMPELAQDLAPLFQSGAVQHWKNTRCVTLDRLPLVGPLVEADDPSLWICAGMSSRGMSFSVLCAELLAAQWGCEPLPVGATLAQSLLALRGRGAQLPTTQD